MTHLGVVGLDVVCRYVCSFDFFFSSRRRHTRWNCDWSSDVCSSDLAGLDTEFDGQAQPAPGATVGLLEQEPHLDESKDVRGNVEKGVAETKALLDRFNRSEERRVGKECSNVRTEDD